MIISQMFLFDMTVPTIEYMYASGLILSLVVFGATYFHRQVGLITLLIVGLICARDIETPEIVHQAIIETGQSYNNHWNYSSRMTLALSIILFFTAIILKRRLKRKIKLN